MSRKKERFAIALSPVTVAKLDYIARRLSVSRSAVIEFLAEHNVDCDFCVCKLRLVPLSPTPLPYIRDFGASSSLLVERFNFFLGGDMYDNL